MLILRDIFVNKLSRMNWGINGHTIVEIAGRFRLKGSWYRRKKYGQTDTECSRIRRLNQIYFERLPLRSVYLRN